jgi:hypothetical protein
MPSKCGLILLRALINSQSFQGASVVQAGNSNAAYSDKPDGYDFVNTYATLEVA